MHKSEVTFAPIIPLIGGFPLGAEKALGKPPEFVSSIDGFWANDSQYMNYQNSTRGRDIEYRILDPEDREFKEKVNIVVGTPPCAALSQLNTGKTDEVRGSGCAKNEFMYIVAEQSIHCYNADVIIIENAPALFTNKGEAVAKRLEEIALENDYSISFYKTSTIYHGIPQNRDRCFAFLWKSKTAPIVNWFEKNYIHINDYIQQVPLNSVQQDVIINEKLNDDPYLMFIQHWTGNKNIREEINKLGKKTSLQWLVKTGLLDEAIKWFHEIDHEKGIKLAEHAKYKFSIGKGVWDGSAQTTPEYSPAWIARNMVCTLHPLEDRSFTIRESFHMMGFPHDYELVGGKKNLNLISQNVPVCTAADMVSEAVKFLNNELVDSGLTCFKQNNHNKKFITKPKEDITELPI